MFKLAGYPACQIRYPAGYQYWISNNAALSGLKSVASLTKSSKKHICEDPDLLKVKY
jgi:hypothetical protein